VSKLASLLLQVLLFFSTISAFAQDPAPDPRDLERDVQAALRSAISMVAYSECWRLWEGASHQSRIGISRDETCKHFDRATSRPVAGGGIEDSKITSTSPTTAVIAARIRVESRRTGSTQEIPRSFTFFFEDGRWRYYLWDYISLLMY